MWTKRDQQILVALATSITTTSKPLNWRITKNGHVIAPLIIPFILEPEQRVVYISSKSWIQTLALPRKPDAVASYGWSRQQRSGLWFDSSSRTIRILFIQLEQSWMPTKPNTWKVQAKLPLTALIRPLSRSRHGLPLLALARPNSRPPSSTKISLYISSLISI